MANVISGMVSIRVLSSFWLRRRAAVARRASETFSKTATKWSGSGRNTLMCR